MVKQIKKTGLLFCVILLASTTFAQRVNRDAFIRDSLDLYINQALTKWRIPGAAVFIIKDNYIILSRGYGIRELGLNDKVDENTLFMIGSNTKAFTATGLAMLEAENKLNLNDPVTKYLPWFRLDNKAATEQANLRDLLSHRLGYKTFQGDFTFFNSNYTRPQIIERLGQLKGAYPFRTKWGYCNAAFLTAGEVLSKAAGQPWEAFMKEKIFAPIGMTNTLALTTDLPKAINRTVAHTLVDERLTAIPYGQLDGMAPAMSISSSASDMGKWVRALLDNGKVGARQVIPLSALQATRQPQSIVGSSSHLNGEINYQLYGLGWFLQDYSGHRLVMHDGGVNGYVSSVTLSPQDNLGIVILTNTDENQFYEALRWEILDAYFKMPFRNYSDSYLANYKNNTIAKNLANKKLRDSTLFKRPPAMSINNYTGKYHNDLYGDATITRGEGNDLEMRFEHHPKMYVRMQPLGGNRFYAVFSDPIYGKTVFPFTLQNGRITSVRVKVADFVEQDPYEFKKVN